MGNLIPNFKRKNSQSFDGESAKFKSAIKILKREKYKFNRKLGMGTFADVIEVRTLSCCKISKFAAKIVSSNECSYVELKLWRSFKHDNVLSLLKIIREFDITIFLMPLHKMTMMEAVEHDSFLEDHESFNMTKNWIADVLRGLDYLHAINICHADLKINNILITKRRTAVVCDFTFSCLLTGNILKFGLPQFFRPPEAFNVLDSVNGIYFDLWSAGMLALFTWTRIWCDEVIPSLEFWKKVAYPVLFDCLQLPKFTKLVKDFFPNAVISPDDISQALNLLQGVLQYDAERRPRASVILHHPLFNKEARLENPLEVSSIWTHRHFQLLSDLENSSNDMDEWASDTEIDISIQSFTNLNALTNDSPENKTDEFDKNLFNLSVSSDASSSRILSKDAERYFDKDLHINIMKNRESTDVNIPVVMDHSDDDFEESIDSQTMQDYQLGKAETKNKSLSAVTSEFCHSQLQYLGYSLFHELLMTI